MEAVADGTEFTDRVVKYVAIPAETNTGDCFERQAPADIFYCFFAVAANDYVYVWALGKPKFGVFGGVATADDDRWPGADGTYLFADEFGVAIPVYGEADEVGFGAQEVLCSAGFLTHIDDIEGRSVRLNHRSDVFEAERRKEGHMFQVAPIRVRTKYMSEHLYLQHFL